MEPAILYLGMMMIFIVGFFFALHPKLKWIGLPVTIAGILWILGFTLDSVIKIVDSDALWVAKMKAITGAFLLGYILGTVIVRRRPITIDGIDGMTVKRRL